MDNLFENYELFLREHSNDITSPSDAIKLIADKSMFESYVAALTDSLEPKVRASVVGICNRQRSMLLTEAANVPAAQFGFGWTVLSLPILVDIYSEPLIAELCNVYTTDSPIASIPYAKIYATTTNYDGTTSEKRIPINSSGLVRANLVTQAIPPAEPYNILTETFPTTSASFRMNRRYLNVTSISITATASGGGTVDRTITCNFRPDNRSQILDTFTFLANDDAIIECTFQGHVNWDTGSIFYNIVVDDENDTTDTAFTINTATFNFRFTPITSMVGRTKVTPKVEMTDVTIDQGEDFLLDLPVEDIQDYKSIFKIDLARLLSEAIKQQIMLNKDYDLSYFLQGAQTDINTNGAQVTVDFDKYTQSATTLNYAPTNILDVFKNISPKIAYVMGMIRKNFNMYPSYMVTGLNTASMLRSLQDMAVSMPGLQGDVGFSGSMANFLKLKILESVTIPDDDIYLSTKAPANALENSTILDLIYKPLYVVSETTDKESCPFMH